MQAQLTEPLGYFRMLLRALHRSLHLIHITNQGSTGCHPHLTDERPSHREINLLAQISHQKVMQLELGPRWSKTIRA